jgi:glycosyltransferase involved in cell wall biosynthesis
MGADILEYPLTFEQRNFAENRAWDSSVAASRNDFMSRLKTKLRYRFFRHQVAAALQKSAFITGDNEVLTDAVRDWFGISPKKIHLNRWGVEPEMFAANDAQLAAIRQRFRLTAEQRVVLSPRGMKPIYQGDIIMDAFAALLRDGRAHTGHKYVMLGAGYPVPEAVMQRARALEKEFPNFIFIPEQLPREVVLHLWNFVDIFVNAPVYDGYSNALAEGRFVGAIPIVNDTPATQELIRHGENGLVVAPFTAPNLANALAESLRHLEAYQPIFAHSNSDWIAENSLLSTNIRDFIACCEVAIIRKNK